MNLYRVYTQGLTSPAFNPAYVAAENPSQAYDIVLAFLNAHDYGFARDRVLKSVELVAMTGGKSAAPNGVSMLFLGES